MTVNELILKNKHEVRRDSNLMSLYLKYFTETFKKSPSCAGCTFSSDWQKLVSFYSVENNKSVTLQKVNPMKTITIKKIQGKILTYQKNGKTFRLYDNILNDAFIKEYISNGTKEEIEERKKMFNFPVEDSGAEEIKPIKIIVQNTEAYEADKAIETIQPIIKKRARKSKK